MESWTPEQWVVFIVALSGAVVAIIAPLTALGKYYIDHLAQVNGAKIEDLESAVKQLQHDRKRDRRRIKQLVAALKANNIPVPPEETDEDEEDA